MYKCSVILEVNIRLLNLFYDSLFFEISEKDVTSAFQELYFYFFKTNLFVFNTKNCQQSIVEKRDHFSQLPNRPSQLLVNLMQSEWRNRFEILRKL